MKQLILLCAAAILCGRASVARGEPNAARSPRLAPIPGRAVGLLVADVEAILAAEGRTGPDDALGFAWQQSSCRWVYVPCDGQAGETIVASVGTKIGGRRPFQRVCLLTAKLASQRTLPPGYALVEAEVNGGAGCPGVESFVATELRVLDGTTDYPLRVDAIVSAAKAELARRSVVSRVAIDEKFAELAAAHLGDRPLAGKRETTNLAIVTWRTKSRRLVVDLRRRVVDGAWRFAAGQRPDAAPENDLSVRYGTSVVVEVRTVGRYDPTGRRVALEAFPVHGYVSELPPPR